MNKKPRVYLYYKGDTIGKDLPPLVEESAYERLETDNLNLFGMNQHHIKEIEELSAEIEKLKAHMDELTNCKGYASAFSKPVSVDKKLYEHANRLADLLGRCEVRILNDCETPITERVKSLLHEIHRALAAWVSFSKKT